MSEAPERIWACPPSIFDDCDVWKMQKGGDDETEYVRADLYATQAAEIAALQARVVALQTIIADNFCDTYWRGIAGSEARAIRAALSQEGE